MIQFRISMLLLALGAVAIAPGQEAHHRRPEIAALLCQVVLIAVARVGPPLEDAGVTQPGQAGLEDVARDPQAVMEILVAPDPGEDVADDEQAPALTDDLQRPGEGAFLLRVVAIEHCSMVPARVASRNPRPAPASHRR